ncbi:heparin lyase I family protein [Bradyrhizobium sp. Tv2a-2]|uniref:heparin lyase I family protein n=1 Tax=Bradyrhizobium sp. Tv2a-2 TaxID=113395 RepID=UPI0003FFC0B1|nr:heparin lyase I family protein [Bradyrhizobium sp. Tv2a-2]
MDTTGTITKFAPAPKTYIDIGGAAFEVETAGRSYSLTNPDPQTLQFEIQRGDHAWFDPSSKDRAEVDGSAGGYIQPGTPVAIDYQFMVQPNGPNNTFTNTASWFVTGEMHNEDEVSGAATSPPFAIQLAGNHLQVVARYSSPGQNPGSPTMLTLWTDPNPITPGQYNNIQIQANVSNTGGGYLHVSVNGTQVVNYSGPLGYGAPTYWEEGLYRNSGPTESVTADFRNTTVVTGAQAAGWTGVGGTTTPIAPVSGGGAAAPTDPATPLTSRPGLSGGIAAPTDPATPLTSRPGLSRGIAAPTDPATPVLTGSGLRGGASLGDVAQLLNSHPDFASPAATLSEAGASRSGTVPNLGTTPDLASSAGTRAYALLNQMMAGDFGGQSHFAQAATALSASSPQQTPLLTRSLR